jgi:O-antigen/teichoic acid export membrane protein
MGLVAGKDFTAAGPVLNILIIAAGMIFLGNVFAHAIIAADRQKSIIPAYIFTAITSIIAYLIFIPRYSYFGAAWVTVYSEAVIAFFSFYIIWKYARFAPRMKIFFKALLAAFAMFAVLRVLKEANLFLAILAGAGSYFLILYLINGITREDLSLLHIKDLPAPIAKDINEIP